MHPGVTKRRHAGMVNENDSDPVGRRRAATHQSVVGSRQRTRAAFRPLCCDIIKRFGNFRDELLAFSTPENVFVVGPGQIHCSASALPQF